CWSVRIAIPVRVHRRWQRSDGFVLGRFRFRRTRIAGRPGVALRLGGFLFLLSTRGAVAFAVRVGSSGGERGEQRRRDLLVAASGQWQALLSAGTMVHERTQERKVIGEILEHAL